MRYEIKILKYAVGIDISKADFKACFVSIDNNQHIKIIASRSFSNSNAGFKKLDQWINQKRKDNAIGLVLVLEATGVYYENLAFFLQDKQYALSVVLPNKAKKYLEYLGLKSKTDKIDAQGLAQMAAQQQLRLWQPATKFWYELRALTRHYQNLQEQKTAVGNQLEAATHSANSSNFVLKSLKLQIKRLNLEVKKAAIAIKAQVQKDEKVYAKILGICKLKGLAILSVTTVLAETFGFELFENYKQLISYAGYDVVENQSGKRSGKTKISKKGNSRIRRILYMPAFVAVEYQQTVFCNLYNRIYEKSGIKMKGYVAVQKKLLVTIFAMWKNNTAYDNDYHKINIRRNGSVGVSLSGTSSSEAAIITNEPMIV